MDERRIFREATLSICSHLEIEEVLKSCFVYHRSFIPIRKMYLHLEDPEAQSMQFIARTSATEAEQLDQTLRVPEELHSQFAEYERHVRTSGDQIFAFAEPNGLAKLIFDFLDEPHRSGVKHVRGDLA